MRKLRIKHISPFILTALFIIVNIFFKSGANADIILLIRVPETLCALLVGFALGFSGCLAQILFKNPLSDPYILGISSGSSLGISIAFITGIYYIFGYYGIFFFSIMAGLFSIFAVYFIFLNLGKNDNLSLLLTGIVYGYICSSITAIILSNLPGEKIHSIIDWLFGTTSFYNIKILIVYFFILVIVFFYMFSRTMTLDKMLLSEKKAITLGVDIKKYRIVLFICISILVSISVSISGIIGFLGLLSPHIARSIFSTKSKGLMPYSGIIGANLLLMSHFISKNIEFFYIPVGMIISIVGGVYFLILLKRRRNAYLQ